MVEPTKNIMEVLREVRGALEKEGIIAARLEAELLVGYILRMDRLQLYLSPRLELTGEQEKRIAEAVEQRVKGKPLQYITGTQEFMSLEFTVNPHVLIPRPETEMLVELAIDQGSGIRDQGSAKDRDRRPAPGSRLPGDQGSGDGLRVLDLCTGSGAIAVSVAHYLPEAEVWATDISPDALAVARLNAKRHNVEGKITFCQGDLFAALPEEARFHLILSNPPYIPTTEISKLTATVREFEPHLALDGGTEGLDFYRRIAAGAPERLTSGGMVAVETGMGQARTVAELFAAAGLQPREILKDFANIERVVVAQKGA